MTSATWLSRLEDYQGRLFKAVRQFSADDYKKQYHPDLSPAGWHIGHCLFTENYWLYEVILEQKATALALKSLYVPELSPRPERGAALPDFADLFAWAASSQADNRKRLAQLQAEPIRHPLLRREYLPGFLCQHYAQHYEAVVYGLIQRQLQTPHCFSATQKLQAKSINQDYTTLPAGRFCIGSKDDYCPYDNEMPGFDTELEACHIAHKPVSNAEFLGFIEAGAYTTRAYWSQPAWDWLQAAQVTAPEHWRQDKHHNWFGIDQEGAHPLPSDAPVHGINHHEASAFANWAGARLPHEYEWEAAQRCGLLHASGTVWEWCANLFHPYAGFKAFPYAGYSRPYFDSGHYALRGGSIHTQDIIKRTSFRNFYRADKRHQHAGLRLVFR